MNTYTKQCEAIEQDYAEGFITYEELLHARKELALIFCTGSNENS